MKHHEKHHKKHHREHYDAGGATPPGAYAHGGHVKQSRGYEEDPGTEVYRRPGGGEGMTPAKSFVTRGVVHMF